MTDEELDRRLNGWQIEVGSVTEQVMALMDEAPTQEAAGQRADLLDEVRMLRQEFAREMQALRQEVAALRLELAAVRNPPTAHPTIKGYPLLPFARPEDQVPFLQ